MKNIFVFRKLALNTYYFKELISLDLSTLHITNFLGLWFSYLWFMNVTF